LPQYCEPENAFLLHFSSTFHTCVPTNLAFISTLLGTLSIVSWLFAQLPQIYKNYNLKSTSGLSIFFLGEWLLGDASNLLGSLFTHQALWQIIIACYYCFVDCMLVGQWVWYEHLRHGKPLIRIWRPKRRDDGPGDMSDFIDGMSVSSAGIADIERSSDSKGKPIPQSSPRNVFHTPRYSSSPSKEGASSTPSNRTITRLGTSSSPIASPRTVIYISLLLAVAARASPLSNPSPTSPTHFTLTSTFQTATTTSPTSTETAGVFLSWLSTLLYLCSRLPQLYKNHIRKSTTGLSPTLFIAAFFGNLFYSSSLLTNPCAWSSFPAHGGRGWVGPEGSVREEWVGLAAPFWLGAAGVLVMDAAVGAQFWWFGRVEGEDQGVVVVAEREAEGKGRWRWRRVSGWMRGWVPS
ncbi:hypothetical protein K490DRAFT_9918, partial [Saccharata proteae CBS 121410]